MDALAAYSKTNQQTQENLVQAHAILVKRIAYHLMSRLPQSIQLDDLIQAGMIGLLEAGRNYDASKGASFETYAGIRIKGHMLDEVRQNDWVPRSVHRNSRKIAEAVQYIENQLGREAKDSEIAHKLEISLTEYYEMLQDSVGSHLYGFDDLGVTEDVLYNTEEGHYNIEPQIRVVNDNLMSHLNEIIDGLPKNEHLALSLYFEHDLNLKEIGDIIGVSESRVSQILSQAILHTRARLPD